METKSLVATWTSIGLLALGLAGGAGWKVGTGQCVASQADLAACERALKANYPHLLEDIGKAAEGLRAHLETLRSRDLLEEELRSAVARLGEAEKERSELQARAEQAEAALAEIRSDEQVFRLTAGKASTLAGGTVRVGFTKASTERVCSIIVNDQPYELQAGQSVEVTSLNRPCRVVLESCQWPSDAADGRLICQGTGSAPDSA